MFGPFITLSHSFLFLNTASLVLAFSFTTNTPTQCDSLNIQWTGGTAPFQLLMIPQFGIPRNFSIPDSAFSNGKGSYSTTLPFNQSTELILTMSDSTGFGSGGNTGILTVGSSLGGSCNTSNPALAFTFELNNALEQCGPYVFSGYSGAVQPVTIMGVIPGGESFVLNPPTGSNSFTWTIDISSATTVIFLMVDSLGRQGGSSDFETVLSSTDSSCINGNSPSSTIGSTISTSTPSPTNTPVPTPTPTSSSGIPTAAIIGIVVGAVTLLAAVILVLFFLKRFNTRKEAEASNPSTRLDLNSGGNEMIFTPFDPSQLVNSDREITYHFSPLPQSDPQSLSSSSAPHSPRISHFNTDTFSAVGAASPDQLMAQESSSRSQVTTTMSSSAQQKAAMARQTSPRPSRFILHSDIEDVVSENPDEEVVELPPQYSERRNPLGLS